MFSEMFIKAGDVFESLTFNLLSKETTELIHKLGYASDQTETPPGETRKNISISVSQEAMEKIREQTKEACAKGYKKYLEFKEAREKLAQMGISNSINEANDSLTYFEQFSDAEALCKKNVACFLRTLIMVLENIKTIKQVYKQYTVTDEFGRIDTTRATKKIGVFVADKIDGRYGTIPPEDCIKFVLMYCQFDMTFDVLLKTESNPRSTSGIEFENKCQQVLKSNGFDVTLTPKTGDFGADLIARKADLIFSIQCKDHIKPIGISAVQEAHSAKEYYATDFAVVVSNSTFTPAALQLAGKLNVICINVTKLHTILDICENYL